MDIEAEMARIASLSRRIRSLADLMAISYAFFIYAAGITGFTLVGRELAPLLGVSSSTGSIIGNALGVIVSTVIVVNVYSFLFRYAGIRPDNRATTISVLAGIALGFLALGAYTLALSLTGQRVTSPWYPWFGGYMLGLGLYPRREEASSQYPVIAGTAILATTPLTVLGDELLLVGLIDTVFTLTGFQAIRSLARQLEQ